MDKSKEYIEMCRAAKEILNGYWEPGVGDFIYVDTEESVQIIVKINYQYYGDGEKDINEIIFTDTDYGTEAYTCGVNKCYKCFWLPRQDQFQELLADIPNCLVMFNSYCIDVHSRSLTVHYNDLEIKFDAIESLEMTWLRFYMEKRHSREYRDGKWVRILREEDFLKAMFQVSKDAYFNAYKVQNEKIRYDDFVKVLLGIYEQQRDILESRLIRIKNEDILKLEKNELG